MAKLFDIVNEVFCLHTAPWAGRVDRKINGGASETEHK
jgi:hypothetical protein